MLTKQCSKFKKSKQVYQSGIIRDIPEVWSPDSGLVSVKRLARFWVFFYELRNKFWMANKPRFVWICLNLSKLVWMAEVKKKKSWMKKLKVKALAWNCGVDASELKKFDAKIHRNVPVWFSSHSTVQSFEQVAAWREFQCRVRPVCLSRIVWPIQLKGAINIGFTKNTFTKRGLSISEFSVLPNDKVQS